MRPGWRQRARTDRWSPSRIGLRLLAFNLLVVFVPVLGILYLDVYETRLLEAQERAMVQQGRVLAAAIADQPSLDPAVLRRTFGRYGRRGDARLRVYDARGALVADSAREPAAAEDLVRDGGDAYERAGIRRRILYRLGAWLAKARERVGSTVRSRIGTPDAEVRFVEHSGGIEAEVAAALAGRYGAATRITSGQRSLTLYSAVPVRDGERVIGAVVVSQSTFRILQALYDVRLRIFEIVIASIVAAGLLTTLAAMTIVRPLRRLRRQAAALAETRGPLPHMFPGANRADELGDLARALGNLTRRLDGQIRLLETFAADVSHEFRNPLGSVRTAAEMMAVSEDAADRERFLRLMSRDVERLQRLVSGVRELARIDGGVEQDPMEPIALGALLHELVDGLALARPEAPRLVIEGIDGDCVVEGSREPLRQLFENVFTNALSFAPLNSSVLVTIVQDQATCRVEVADSGPGIPEGHLERVFERFFSYRPGQDRREHVGLGLAIARAVVEGYGGSISARNRHEGGAVFAICLPLSSRRVGTTSHAGVSAAPR